VRSHDVVLLHGQPGLGAEWQQVQARLPAKIRATAPDRPGHGSSRVAGGGMDVNVSAVLEDLDARGIERAVLVGHSYGGGVALNVAARAPGRVEALILLASVGPDCLTGWDRLLAAPVTGPVTAVFAWKLTPWLARIRLRRIAARLGSELAVRRYVNWLVWGCTRWQYGPLWRTFLAEQRALVREADDFATVAASVLAPVLLVSDPNDTMVPFRTTVALSKALADVRLHLIDDAGHHLPMRAPDRVAQEIVEFLDSLDARSGTNQASGP
jgi:pimeloyl-ACP methyl ester carboxylesterase